MDIEKEKRALEYLKAFEPAENISESVKKLSGRNECMLMALQWVYRHSGANMDRVQKVFGNIVLNAQIDNVAIGNVKHALQLIDNAYNRNLSTSAKIRFVSAYENCHGEKKRNPPKEDR